MVLCSLPTALEYIWYKCPDQVLEGVKIEKGVVKIVKRDVNATIPNSYYTPSTCSYLLIQISAPISGLLTGASLSHQPPCQQFNGT